MKHLNLCCGEPSDDNLAKLIKAAINYGVLLIY